MLGTHDACLGSRPKAQNNNKGREMKDVLVAQRRMREAYPLARYGKLDNVFYEACRFINRLVHKDFTHRRARSIWEGTARRIDAEEMEALEAAQMEEARREQRELRQKLSDLDQRIAAFDASSSRKEAS